MNNDELLNLLHVFDKSIIFITMDEFDWKKCELSNTIYAGKNVEKKFQNIKLKMK